MSLPRVLAIGGGVLGAGYIALSMMGDFKTPGMKNIEDRFSSAGGGVNQTPAQASPMGRSDLVEGRHGDSNSGVSSKSFQEGISDQRVDPGPMKERFNKALYDNPKGK